MNIIILLIIVVISLVLFIHVFQTIEPFEIIDIDERNNQILDKITQLNDDSNDIKSKIEDLNANKIPEITKKLADINKLLLDSRKLFKTKIEAEITNRINSIAENNIKCIDDRKNIDQDLNSFVSKSTDIVLSTSQMLSDIANKRTQLKDVKDEYNLVKIDYDAACSSIS
jgi:hypothetical protein